MRILITTDDSPNRTGLDVPDDEGRCCAHSLADMRLHFATRELAAAHLERLATSYRTLLDADRSVAS